MTNPPWLFIYFKEKIKVIQPMRSVPDDTAMDTALPICGCDNPGEQIFTGFKFVPRDELWITGIGHMHMVRHIVPKTYIDMWARNFISLLPGCAWTAIVCSPPGFLAFRPWSEPQNSELLVPTGIIHRIFDMANNRLVHAANMAR